MISIRVASFNGAHVAPLAATFDAEGGSIGRADGNRLVLPDPDHVVSRVHAEIVHAGGGRFAVVNRGANEIVLNGRPIRSGEQQPIAPADELQIGGYQLLVAAGAASPGPDAGVIPADWDALALDPLESPPLAPPYTSAAAPAAAASLDDIFGDLPPAPQAVPLVASPGASESVQLHPRPVPPAAGGNAGGVPMERRAPEGAVLSWTSPSGESLSTIGSGGRAEGLSRLAPDAPAPPAGEGHRPAPARASGAASLAPSIARGAVDPKLAAHPSDPGWGSANGNATPHNAPREDVQALDRAWREGLGAQGLPSEALHVTAALLFRVGRLLREATHGTVDLLAARAALKREIRAEVTMIVAHENNPLKFSATADIALGHLLGSPERGFIPAEDAMRDAYEDLRAHQFATLAGMRAALEGIFGRFDPALLESRLAEKSMVESLLPSVRKARMWELFNEMYAQLAVEASDDFHELFGKAFLQAYEQHIAELAKGRS